MLSCLPTGCSTPTFSFVLKFWSQWVTRKGSSVESTGSCSLLAATFSLFGTAAAVVVVASLLAIFGSEERLFCPEKLHKSEQRDYTTSPLSDDCNNNAIAVALVAVRVSTLSNGFS